MSGLWCKFTKRLLSRDPKVETAIVRGDDDDDDDAQPQDSDPEAQIVGDDDDYLLTCEVRGGELRPHAADEDD